METGAFAALLHFCYICVSVAGCMRELDLHEGKQVRFALHWF
jgi:hypothetical protein